MGFKMKYTALALLLFIPALSIASPCKNAKDIQSFNLCAFDFRDKAFKSLEKTYKIAIKNAENSDMSDDDGATSLDYLINSQKLWWKLKDLECKSPMWNFGSSGNGSVAICEAQKAELRNKELLSLYK